RIGGRVSYGGLTPEEVGRRYRGEVAYNQEDDVHFPTLTVRKTLEFAIQCKTPSKRVLDDRAAYEKEFLDTLLDMYGLTGCADTIVGNAFLRGVSGGERKRVSIAEQVASGASIDIWDGSTKGLDSSSALDYVRSLRITTDVLHKSTVVTIYQASESIYELFDKVMVIDEGRQLYFGPARDAVAYFRAIGIDKPLRQTTSDFLTGVTQLHERKVLAGWEDRAPRSAADFERAWLESPQFQQVKHQVAHGAFSSGGLFFFALLFNSLAAQAEIPKAITGREVVYKHKSFAMYHPAALSLAQTIVDIPFLLLQIVLFSCILYFATGLSRTAS
ncbi:ATP-binding cassette transporter snq2, partial [Coemansia sp. RSA 2673]